MSSVSFEYHLIFDILQLQMKRKPSSEQFVQEIPFKQTAKKSRSPNNLKKKPKFENQVLSFLGAGKSKVVKHKQDILKYELKGDSHNSTANCTFSRSRIPKSKKIKQKDEKIKKNESLSEHDIMQIINNFATKIQRQWRVHMMRKHFTQLIHSIKKPRKSIEPRQHLLPEVSSFEKLKFDENRIRHLSYLTENGQEVVSSYNLQKYQQYEQSPRNSKELPNNDPLSYRSHSNSEKISIKLEKQSGLAKKGQAASQKVICKEDSADSFRNKFTDNTIKEKIPTAKIQGLPTKNEIIEKEDRRTSYDSCQLQKRSNIQNRRHSTGDLLFDTREVKPFQIGKAFQIKIEQEERQKAASSTSIKKAGENSPAKRGEDEREGFNIKYPFDKQLKHKRKQIEEYKKNKLLSIEGRFNRKQVTERSYLEIVRKINEQHDNKIEYFKQHEGEIRSNWCKLFAVSKQNRLASKYLEDDHEPLHNSISNIDASVSFDKWDFNSSAKKSIDANLEIELQNSKNYSLQSVLRYLEDEDAEKDQEQRKFRKNKSRQVIQAIAERSKQISDKSVQEFHEIEEIPHKIQEVKAKVEQKLEFQTHKQLEYIEIKAEIIIEDAFRQFVQDQQGKHYLKENVSDKKGQEFRYDSIQVQNEQIFQSASKKKIQPKIQSQSLLISQIQAASPSDNMFSQKEIVQSGEKAILKDLLFKNFHSEEDQPQSPLVEAALHKFIEIVNQKLVLSNIKLINSIKFMFAKMGEQKKQLKAKALTKYPPIESDINAINTWLLQISHFILDNYQPVIKENIITVKQPPGHELLGLAQKNLPYINPYESVPQYVFKDFQFHYIKTLARNYGIGADKYDAFSTLLYTFHRSLIDCLNLALVEEVITGRQWLEVPWRNDFKQKKKIINEHTKVCLERSINVVSNWGEYGLGRLQFEDEIAELQSKQYQEQKINLVCREQALDLALCPIFTEAHMLLDIANLIFEEEMQLAWKELPS